MNRLATAHVHGHAAKTGLPARICQHVDTLLAEGMALLAAADREECLPL